MTLTLRQNLRNLTFAFAVATTGATLFWCLGFPAPFLTGAATAVSLAAVNGLKCDLPAPFRNIVFVILGLNIGTGITPEVLNALTGWLISLPMLALSLVITIFAGRWLLVHGFGYDRTTAVLASTPGHLSYVLALGLETMADTRQVALVQSIRLLLLTLVVPPLVSWFFETTGQLNFVEQRLAWSDGVALCLVSLAVGWVFLRLHLPAAFLLAAMGVSAIGHGSGLTPGHIPESLTILAFLAMGVLIGSRFSGTTVKDLSSAAYAGVAVTGLALMSAAMAGVAILFFIDGLTPALLIVAFTPGGVEAMAAIGLALGLDMAFIAGHHVARLLMLTVLLPFFIRSKASPTK